MRISQQPPQIPLNKPRALQPPVTPIKGKQLDKGARIDIPDAPLNAPPTPSELDDALLQRHDSFAVQYQNLKQQTVKSDKKDRDVQGVHMVFELKALIASICFPGECTQLFFSLYNHSERRFISEEYAVRLTYNGMPVDEEKIGKLYTIFADLGKRDLAAEVFLVCRIVRIGRMTIADKDEVSQSSSKVRPLQNSFRRPFGFAVLDVGDIIAKRTASLSERTMKIYTPQSEQHFATLYENIIAKCGGYETSIRAEMIVVGVAIITGDVRVGLLQIPVVPQDIEITHRYGFPEIVYPGDQRNSVYLTLVSGEFIQGRKTSGKNIEVEIQVRSGDGKCLPFAIFSGTGNPRLSTYESVIFYHNNSPKYNETVRLDIPLDQIDQRTHVFFTFRHCSSGDKSDKSERSFAFSELPLMRSHVETVIPDGDHKLRLFRFEKKSLGSEAYLSSIFDDLDPMASQALGDSASISSVNLPKLSAMKDSFVVRTSLCSTLLTQDVSLLNLLNWRKIPQADMRSILKNFTFIGPLEITKYMQNILNELFGILQMSKMPRSSLSSDVPSLVFSAIVFVLNIVISDKRFINFRPVLDVYVKEHFGHSGDISLVWCSILDQMCLLAANPKDHQMATELRSSIKAWEYIFKFIVKSWSYQVNASSSAIQKNDIVHLVKKLVDLLISNIILPDNPQSDSETYVNKPASFIGAQILLLQQSPFAFDQLFQCPLFSSQDLCLLASRFMDAFTVPRRKILEMKTAFCYNLVCGAIFTNEISSQRICDMVVAHCKLSLATKDDVICSSALQLLFTLVYTFKQKDLQQSFLIQAKSLVQMLGDLLDIWLNQENQHQTRKELFSLILAIVDSLSHHDMKVYLQSLKHNMYQNIFKILKVFDEFVASDLVQFELNVECFWIIHHFHKIVFGELQASVPTSDCIWITLLKSVVFVILEAKDMDVQRKSAQTLSSIWKFIGAFQKDASHIMAAQFVELSFVQTSEVVKNIASELLAQCIIYGRSFDRKKRASTTVHDVASKFSSIEVLIIEKLDAMVMIRDKGNNEYHVWLQERLEQLLPQQEYSNFLQSVDKFLSLAVSARIHIADDNVKQVQKQLNKKHSRKISITSASLNVENQDEDLTLLLSHLLHFTSVLERTTLYLKYLYQLVDIHLENKQLTEAGWALKLHADLYTWKSDQVDPLDLQIDLTNIMDAMGSVSDRRLSGQIGTNVLEGLLESSNIKLLHSTQTSFARKEILYLVIIKLWIDACKFEHAIKLLQELLQQYTIFVYDYSKASAVHKIIGSVMLQITSVARYYPAFFRVMFLGRGWLSNISQTTMVNVRGKQFIFATRPYEKLGEFIDRILKKYPDAQLTKDNAWPPSQEVVEADGKFLLIGSVDAVPNYDLHGDVLSAAANSVSVVPENIVNWYKNNDIDTFTFSRPFRLKGKQKSSNEFLDLWTEVWTMKTENSFPFFLKKSEVLSLSKTEVSPIENALQGVNGKTKELLALELRFSRYAPQQTESVTSSSQAAHRVSRSFMSQSVVSNSSATPVNFNPLTMSLNGAVDCPVNGGIQLYKNAFLSASFSSEYPQYLEMVELLKDAIDAQVVVINRCLRLHGMVVPADLQPLHESLLQLFKKNFRNEIERLKLQ